jgi:hypothetical protein
MCDNDYFDKSKIYFQKNYEKNNLKVISMLVNS